MISRLSVITNLQVEIRTLADPININYVEPSLEKYSEYEIRYLFIALLSRGSIVKDFLLGDKNRRDFFDNVYEKYQEDKPVGYFNSVLYLCYICCSYNWSLPIIDVS